MLDMLRRLQIGLALLVLSVALAPAQSPDVVVGDPTKNRIQVIVESTDGAVKSALTRAFSMHGHYEVRTAVTRGFTIEVNPVADRTVDLAIKSAGQELLRQRFTGSSLLAAVTQAADTAVERTSGLRGWFSGTIAFVSDRTGHAEIYTSDLLFERTRQITTDGSQSILPNLSPDASQLIYTGYFRNGFPDLYRIDLRTNRRDVFLAFRGVNTGANFSPDGQRVAIVLTNSGNSEIYTADVRGGQLKRLTRTPALEADPSWSPDASRLVYTSDALGRPQIHVMNADGSGQRRLPTNVSRNCSEPAWNPVDPDLIVFTAAVGSEFELCLYRMGERESRILTRGAGDAVEPVWLPDGRHIIFTVRSIASSYLAVIDTLTGKTTRLTPAQWRRCSMADFAPGSTR